MHSTRQKQAWTCWTKMLVGLCGLLLSYTDRFWITLKLTGRCTGEFLRLLKKYVLCAGFSITVVFFCSKDTRKLQPFVEICSSNLSCTVFDWTPSYPRVYRLLCQIYNLLNILTKVYRYMKKSVIYCVFWHPII